jgi:hypothetical protein
MKKTLLLFSQAGNFMQTTIKRLSTTHKRKEEKERQQEQEKKESGHRYSHPNSMAKGLTLP